MDNKVLKWGILGLGKIAHGFVRDLLFVDDCQLQSVASRSSDKAQEFANIYGAISAYGSYSELFADPEVDIIYIATPHDSHAQFSIEAMQAGKSVLCEKPLAVNVNQVESMINAAKKNDVFLMEAFWSRFNPSIREALTRVEDKELGEVKLVSADFSFHFVADTDSRLYNMNLAGGSILDVGVYPVFLAYSVLGMPRSIYAVGKLHQTGADVQMSAILDYEGAVANLSCGFNTHSRLGASICGTEASIFFKPRWHETQGYELKTNSSGDSQMINLPTKGKGFTYEIVECLKCISLGKKQSDLWSWNNSLDLIGITDEIRRQVGVKYPFE